MPTRTNNFVDYIPHFKAQHGTDAKAKERVSRTGGIIVQRAMERWEEQGGIMFFLAPLGAGIMAYGFWDWIEDNHPPKNTSGIRVPRNKELFFCHWLVVSESLSVAEMKSTRAPIFLWLSSPSRGLVIGLCCRCSPVTGKGNGWQLDVQFLPLEEYHQCFFKWSWQTIWEHSAGVRQHFSLWIKLFTPGCGLKLLTTKHIWEWVKTNYYHILKNKHPLTDQLFWAT